MRRTLRHLPSGGYTLIELMVAMVGSCALLAGLSSAIFIALKATDTSSTPTAATLEGNATLTEILSDIEYAIAFSEITTGAITFTVADRDGDDNPETIRYAWSGTPGDPLTRQYNGGGVATLVENVHVFQHDLPVPSPNLLSNADMELGTTNWQAIPGATMYSQSSVVHAGSVSLYAYRNTASDESGLRQNVTSQLTNGSTYKVCAWMRKWAAPAPFDVKLQLRVNSTGGGEQIFSTDSFGINNSAFLYVNGIVTPTWSGTLLSAHWEATGIGNIQDIYVDDAELRVEQNVDQHVNITLQVGGNTHAQVRSGAWLTNSPL